MVRALPFAAFGARLSGRARDAAGRSLRGAGGLGLALAAAAVLLALGVASSALAAPSFPPLTGRVVDAAHMLSPPTAQKLDQELAALEAQTGRQLVVATIPDLQGYEVADYGYQLGRAWGIGRKGADDGALFIVAPNERKVRIEVGYGLEPVLTDALSSVILQQKVLPRFRAGQMEDGVVAGVEALIQQLALPDDQARANVAQAAQAQQQLGDGGGVPIGLVVAIILVFWVLGSVLRGFGGRRGSGLWWLLPVLMSGGERRGGWGGGGGGFSGGGGSFGGGGASGSW